MKRFPPSVSPRTFTSSAIFVAYLLMNDLTINEQNAVGDWLMLVGQVLQTNASQAQILEDRAQEVEEEKTKDTLETIEKTLERMQQEINHFKKK